MVGCGKGPCCVREGLRIQIFEAALRRACSCGQQNWRCMAGCSKGPHYIREVLRIVILQTTSRHIGNRIKTLWRCMASCRKGPHCVRQFLRMKSFEGFFDTSASHPKALAMHWGLWQMPTLRSRGFKDLKSIGWLFATMQSIKQHW